MQTPGSPGLGWLQGCPKLGLGGDCGPVSSCLCLRKGCSLGKGQWRAVPEEVCSWEPSAANALAAGGVPGLKEPEQCSQHPPTYLHEE